MLIQKSKRSLSKDLNILLSFSIVIIILIAGSLESYFIIKREKLELKKHANTLLNNLSESLESQNVELNSELISAIISRYDNFDYVTKIDAFNHQGQIIFSSDKKNASISFSLDRNILNSRSNLDKIRIHFSADNLNKKNYINLIFSISTLLLILSTLLLIVYFTLSYKLKRPLLIINEYLQNISDGNYNKKIIFPVQDDLRFIIKQATTMAQKIKLREQSLEDKNTHLKHLNLAISKLFDQSKVYEIIKEGVKIIHSLLSFDECYFYFSNKSNDSLQKKLFSDLHSFMINKDGDIVKSKLIPTDSDLKIPLKQANEVIGHIFFKQAASISAEKSTLLNSIISLIQQGLNRIFLIKSEAILDSELELANSVQASLLPSSTLIDNRLEITWAYKPMQKIGGDWFYFWESPNKKELYCMLGDVTGHGIASGLLSTAVTGALRLFEGLEKENYFSSGIPTVDIMSHLQKILLNLSSNGKLGMTCLVMKINFETMNLEYCNAGHPFPILIENQSEKENKLSALTKNQNSMLGNKADKEVNFLSSIYNIPEDCILLLFTDGLTEAKNFNNTHYSRYFLRSLRKINCLDELACIKESLLSNLDKHLGNKDPEDDICLFLIKR